MNPTAHIFFPPPMVASWLTKEAHWIDRYCDLYEARMNGFDDPEDEVFHLWHFMPAPSYDQTVGLHVQAGEQYAPAFGPTTTCLWVLQLPEPDSTLTLRFGKTAVEIARRGRKATCQVADQMVTLTGTGLRLSCRVLDGTAHLAVEGQPLARIPVAQAGLNSSLEVTAGTAAVIMCQSLAPVPCFVTFDAMQSERHQPVHTERNPYRFEWGLRSIRINSNLLMAAVLHDIALAAPPDSNIRHRITALQNRFDPVWRSLLGYWLLWPRWRPGVGDTPEAGPWDRNSFSNGTTAFSVAMAWRLIGQDLPQEQIIHTITLKAGAFFQSQTRLAFLGTSRGRNAKWWNRRSANHGLIMMLTYLTAMRLLDQQDDETARLVQGNTFRALRGLLRDGSFSEGLHYHNFSFIYLLPYRHLIAPENDTELSELEALLPDVHDWWSLCLDDKGSVFANFGDNVSPKLAKDRVSVIAFLRHFATVDLADGLDPEAVDPFTPFVRPAPPAPALQTGLITRFYGHNNFAQAAYINANGRRQSGLFVIGSKLQLTHNRNHDCTGFAFYSDDLDIPITRADSQPQGNNGIGLMTAEGTPMVFEGRRDYSGTVTQPAEAPPGQAVFEVGFEAQVTLQGHGQKSLRATRVFLYAPQNPDILILRSYIWGAKGLIPFVAFNLIPRSATSRHQLYCWGKDADGIWQPLQATDLGNTPVFAADTATRRPVQILTTLSLRRPDPVDLAATLETLLNPPKAVQT